MSTPVITYPEAVFKKKWPGWKAFLGKQGEAKADKKAKKGRRK